MPSVEEASMLCEPTAKYGSVVVLKKNSKEPGMVFPLDMMICSIGSDEYNHIKIAVDNVSKRHCLLFADKNSEMWIRAVGEYDTLLNGKKVTGDQKVRHSDIFTVGSRSFRYEAAASPQDLSFLNNKKSNRRHTFNSQFPCLEEFGSCDQNSVSSPIPITPEQNRFIQGYLQRKSTKSCSKQERRQSEFFNVSGSSLTITSISSQENIKSEINAIKNEFQQLSKRSNLSFHLSSNSRDSFLADTFSLSKLIGSNKSSNNQPTTPDHVLSPSSLLKKRSSSLSAIPPIQFPSYVKPTPDQILYEQLHNHKSSLLNGKDSKLENIGSDSEISRNTLRMSPNYQNRKKMSADIDLSQIKNTITSALPLPKSLNISTNTSLPPCPTEQSASKSGDIIRRRSRRLSIKSKKYYCSSSDSESELSSDSTKNKKLLSSNNHRTVRFGPPLSPEIFDKKAPPLTPLKRGTIINNISFDRQFPTPKSILKTKHSESVRKYNFVLPSVLTSSPSDDILPSFSFTQSQDTLNPNESNITLNCNLNSVKSESPLLETFEDRNNVNGNLDNKEDSQNVSLGSDIQAYFNTKNQYTTLDLPMSSQTLVDSANLSESETPTQASALDNSIHQQIENIGVQDAVNQNQSLDIGHAMEVDSISLDISSELCNSITPVNNNSNDLNSLDKKTLQQDDDISLECKDHNIKSSNTLAEKQLRRSTRLASRNIDRSLDNNLTTFNLKKNVEESSNSTTPTKSNPDSQTHQDTPKKRQYIKKEKNLIINNIADKKKVQDNTKNKQETITDKDDINGTIYNQTDDNCEGLTAESGNRSVKKPNRHLSRIYNNKQNKQKLEKKVNIRDLPVKSNKNDNCIKNRKSDVFSDRLNRAELDYSFLSQSQNKRNTISAIDLQLAAEESTAIKSPDKKPIEKKIKNGSKLCKPSSKKQLCLNARKTTKQSTAAESKTTTFSKKRKAVEIEKQEQSETNGRININSINNSKALKTYSKKSRLVSSSEPILDHKLTKTNIKSKPQVKTIDVKLQQKEQAATKKKLADKSKIAKNHKLVARPITNAVSRLLRPTKSSLNRAKANSIK
ncbi:hypothetical protein BB561_003007 [Smittium simulii]|uniref:FHA domain-containing protein n=1 Tax=Smittium simulii TaxID=133385 RepID=A0A2T9YND3_9FUNG|nr:hypothetical protein BB561_003007 [Smittium simulii]